MYDEYDAAMTTLGMATTACRAKENPESRSAIARLESTHRPWRFWVVWEFVAIVFGADEDGFGDPALSGFSIVFLGPRDIAIRHANGWVSPPISGSWKGGLIGIRRYECDELPGCLPGVLIQAEGTLATFERVVEQVETKLVTGNPVTTLRASTEDGSRWAVLGVDRPDRTQPDERQTQQEWWYPPR